MLSYRCGLLYREVDRAVEMRKLLIAESGEEFRETLVHLVRGKYRVRTCREGAEALDAILTFKPELVVLDMMLPGLDGISIIEEVQRCGLRPMILAVTKLPSDYVLDAAGRLGIAYMMVKPCRIKAVVQRLQDMARKLEEPAAAQVDMRTAVTNALLELGIPTKILGFRYLCEAVLEYRNHPGQLVTKELYPAVGKRCGASAIQVERSIRSAICKAWEHRDEAVWRSWFSCGPGEPLKRPSNAVFITAMVNRLHMLDGAGGPEEKWLYRIQKEADGSCENLVLENGKIVCYNI